MGGMVLETNMTEIITRIDDQNKLEKQEVSYSFFIPQGNSTLTDKCPFFTSMKFLKPPFSYP